MKPISAEKKGTSTNGKKLKAGRGAVGKAAVLGMRERGGRTFAKPVGDTGMDTVHQAIHGVHHHTSRKHLGRYVNEFSFRLNEGNVKRQTLARLDSMIMATAGKRITCKELTA